MKWLLVGWAILDWIANKWGPAQHTPTLAEIDMDILWAAFIVCCVVERQFRKLREDT